VDLCLQEAFKETKAVKVSEPEPENWVTVDFEDVKK